MQISEHAERTEALFGVRAEDIHKWIDGFFDDNGQDHAQHMSKHLDYDPYDHRRFRHCKEALAEAYREFGGRYTHQQIKDVFETHVKDDYDGYLPLRADFENGTFTAKYHDRTHQETLGEVLDERELADYFDGLHNQEPSSGHALKQFSYRIVLPTIAAIILFITSIVFVIVPLVEDSMVDQKRQMLRELTSAAVSIVDSYVELEQQGVLSLSQAQAKAAIEIKTMRYGPENKDYFFITDMHPNMVMHPNLSDLTGHDLTQYTNNEQQTGPSVFVRIVQLVNANQQGFLEYQWQWKNDPTLTAPKMTYVEGIEEWGWIIGTGVYIEDVEQGIAKLENTLSRIFVAITLGLIVLMSYVITQTRKSEIKKKRAELALLEAKDRYRALVESSSEGYILEADGQVIFSNNRLRLLMGYQQQELSSKTVWQTIFTDAPHNAKVIEHLFNLFNQQAEPGEFEAQLKTKQGQSIDIILSTSKIFLAEKLGHVVSFRPIVRKIYGTSFTSSSLMTADAKQTIVKQIQQADSQSAVVESLNQLADQIRYKIDIGTRAEYLRILIGSTYDAAICRFIELTIADIGEPPVPFSFISFGSNARHDMTLFSDQDNAIVFETPDDADLKSIRRYFLHLAEKVCALLNQAGYSYCDGLIMASNHQWCLSQQEWKHNFSSWIESASPDTILELNVFFDIRSTYGHATLVDGIQSHIQSVLVTQSKFLSIYALNCLSYSVPLDSNGGLLTEKFDGKTSINLKECLRPMEIFCRLYALKYDIREVSTIERLRQLYHHDVFDTQTLREMMYLFDHIWNLRFMNQLVEYTDLRKVNDVLAIDDLTTIEQQNLCNVLSRMQALQAMVKRDFS
ncbi:PAS domain S-box protein [Alginatibacterium sediminis]|uniref:PAS domain S-box protein n=1 Tax=Alginatibacterium sediminis TaxID=2164068 RepID=A0A420ENI4_9ALTE|nr:DUF294 nucleotidyltransferase-like domain-containing protein [Alginatibacterium sediminis]RKF22295.1 PAS domain S-box protein [Alginatibacterium sediminis]